ISSHLCQAHAETNRRQPVQTRRFWHFLEVITC
ncbi:hypothetical protein NGA_0090800, partial [Nannochloropsis gaditana CCMP526]